MAPSTVTFAGTTLISAGQGVISQKIGRFLTKTNFEPLPRAIGEAAKPVSRGECTHTATITWLNLTTTAVATLIQTIENLNDPSGTISGRLTITDDAGANILDRYHCVLADFDAGQPERRETGITLAAWAGTTITWELTVTLTFRQTRR